MKVLSMKSVICGLTLAAIALPGPVQAAEFVFQTRDKELFLNNTNQGWWNSAGTATTTNGNYLVGTSGGVEYRNFFTFNLGALPAGSTVTGARLIIYNGTGGITLPGNFNVDGVTTDFLALNNNTGLPPAALFADLLGSAYGSFPLVAGVPTNNIHLSFTLLPAAHTAIAAAAGTWFSVGGSYTGGGNAFGFTSGTFPATLVVTTSGGGGGGGGVDPTLICELMHLLLVPQGQRCTDTPECGFGDFNRGLADRVTPAACEN